MPPFLLLLLLTGAARAVDAPAARWAPVLQAVASPRGVSTFAGLSVGGVELPGLLSRLSAVDWGSADGQALAGPVLERLASQGVVPTQPDAPGHALAALAAVAADLRGRAAALTRAEDPGEERLEAFGRGLDELSRSAAFLTPAQSDEVLTQSRVVRGRIERLWEARAAKAMAAGAGLWPARDAQAVDAEPGAKTALVRLSRPGGLPLKAAQGYPDWAGRSDGTFLDLELPHLRQEQFGNAYRAMDLAMAQAAYPWEVRTAAHQFLIATTNYFEEEASGRPRFGEFLWRLENDKLLALVHRDQPLAPGELNLLVARLNAYRFGEDPPLKDQLKKLGVTLWLSESGRGVSLWVELPKAKPLARRGPAILQLADGFSALALKIRSVNERDRAFARARKAALTGLDKTRVEAARLFLDRAVRFAKEEARERGERVSLQWRRVPGYLELAVRREADHGMGGFSKGTPMRAWHENRWKESLKAEPGLMPRLAALGAEVLAGVPDEPEEPNARRLILRIPL